MPIARSLTRRAGVIMLGAATVAGAVSVPASAMPTAGKHVTRTANAAWGVYLKAPVTNFPTGGTATLTAYTDADVGPTPYYIQIFSKYDWGAPPTRVAVCGGGTSCTASISKSEPTYPYNQEFVAFVSDNTTAYPPTGIQGTSNELSIHWGQPRGGGEH